MHRLIIYCLLSIGVYLIACTEQEVSLSRTELTLVDSLYRQERDLIEPILKDSCLTLREQKLDVLVDSIKKVRIKEIREMIKQYE